MAFGAAINLAARRSASSSANQALRAQRAIAAARNDCIRNRAKQAALNYLILVKERDLAKTSRWEAISRWAFIIFIIVSLLFIILHLCLS